MISYKEKLYEFYNSAKIENKPGSGTCSRKPFYRQLIRRYFPKDRHVRILEIGCGSGEFIQTMQLNGYNNVEGIDVSPEQVDKAREFGIDQVIQADIMTFLKQQKAGSLDVILAIDVLEHFTKQELFELMVEMSRILNETGMVISHQPNGEGLLGGSIVYSDFTHEQNFTRDSMKQIYTISGFSKISSFEDKPIIHGIKSFIRYILWQGMCRIVVQLFYLVETGSLDRNRILSQNFVTLAQKEERKSSCRKNVIRD